MNELIEVLKFHGDFAHDGDVKAAAQEWLDEGFTAAEADEWLDARTFDPVAARRLLGVDIDATLASLETDAGIGGYVDTVGYKVSNGDLSIADAWALV